MNDIIEIACEIRHETDAAYLVDDGAIETWLPKSQCEYENGIMQVPEWLAQEKELI